MPDFRSELGAARSAEPGSRSLLALRIALAALMALLALTLVLLDKPWELGIAERLASGRYPKLDQIIEEGFWYAALANLVLCALLLATSRWWSRPAPKPAPSPAETSLRGIPGPAGRALFAAALAGAMALGAAERWPKMDQSFGNDEEFAFRRLVFGQFETEADGRLSSPELGWQETLFNNRASNNHFLFTALARVSHEIYAALSGEGAPPFSERAARMPSLIAGVLAIGLAGILPALAGLPRAGAAAAFLLALNPWHLRYATEARGYSLMIFFILLALCALVRAADTGRRRYWALYGAAQTLYLLSFPGALHLALAMNLAAAAALARAIPAAEWRSGGWRARMTPFWHLAAANIFSGMAFLQVFSPSVRQLQMFLDQRAAAGPMGLLWLRDVWSHLASGMRWDMDDPANPLLLSIQHSLAQEPAAAVLFLVLMPAAAAAGLARSFCGSPSRMLLVAPTLLAALLAFLHISLAGKFLYAWYVIYAVIGVTLGAALGVDWIGSIRPRRGRLAQAMPGLAAVFCLVLLVAEYGLHTAYPRAAMASAARQPMREAVLAAHGPEHDPLDLNPRGLLTAAIGTSARQKFTYDPRIVPVETDDAKALPLLRLLKEKAAIAGIPLRVLMCNPALVEKEAPQTFALLTGSGTAGTVAPFRVVEKIGGLEAMFTYWICEYRPPRP